MGCQEKRELIPKSRGHAHDFSPSQGVALSQVLEINASLWRLSRATRRLEEGADRQAGGGGETGAGEAEGPGQRDESRPTGRGLRWVCCFFEAKKVPLFRLVERESYRKPTTNEADKPCCDIPLSYNCKRFALPASAQPSLREGSGTPKSSVLKACDRTSSPALARCSEAVLLGRFEIQNQDYLSCSVPLETKGPPSGDEHF